MIWNNLKIAIRNLWRNKIYSLINLFGLAIGLAGCIILSLYVIDEYSYDKHNKNHSRIFRMNTSVKFKEFELTHPTSSPVLAATLIEDFPEVEEAARIVSNFESVVIESETKGFVEERFYWTDPAIIKIFDLKILKGNGTEALKNPYQLIISENTALKYFGSLNVIGKQIKLEEEDSYTIAAIAKDLPKNSHFHFHYLTSIKTHFKNDVTSFNNDGAYTYVLLNKKADKEAFVKKVPALVKKYVEPDLKQTLNMSLAEMEANGDYYRYFAMPLADIHLHSNSIYELESNGDINNVYIFLFSSILILLIACINFTNLSTAKSAQRAKEVGVRKSLGSTRQRLIVQFLAESILLSFTALFIALLMVEASLPFASALLEKQLVSLYHNNSLLILFFLGLALFTGLFAGSYSAFYLSKFDPAKVLKGDLFINNGKSTLRSTLVSVQFCITIFLFVSTLIAFQQMNFVSHKNLGFDKNEQLVVKNVHQTKSMEAFKAAFTNHTSVKNASLASNIPGGFYDGFSIQNANGDDQNNYSVRATTADFDFAETMSMNMLEGRFFSKDFPSDKDGMIVNQALVKKMNLSNPVGTLINTPMGKKTILGVVNDFHFVSLHMKISPLIFMHPEGLPKLYMVINYRKGKKKEVVNLLQSVWKDHTQGFPLEYFFMDDYFAELHRNDNNTMQLFSIFSILSILITCLGLLGLSSFTTEQRTKEIGVRKVLGASNFSILHLLNKDMLKWMLFAIIITSPIAWYVMNKWLSNFAYQTEIQWYIFLISGMSAMLLAIATISWQAWITTRKDPIESLRYE
ncbi:ABC transporter permease [Marinifilum caeruleilacunae]|uniref:ABC transporter permease n=1 Tax=Marinifilum caeruleilacunae TaxID=2499076 RepID=A0ABX1WSD5_9BACT|nr:ABC transporter permease [Marinifilum caeruleilacunae]NOU59007.1 ABC transporter permease [Marinifilum caeruleilacunae]